MVIFGILHHIPAWRQVIRESRRVLGTGGEIFVEEPSELLIRPWDRLFKWGHPPDAQFGLETLEDELVRAGFVLMQRKRLPFLGYYHAVAN